MVEITLKGRITRDHKLTADVPTNVPVGEVRVVVQVPESAKEVRTRNERLIRFLTELQSRPGRPSRSKEDIDKQIEEERNSWD